jgi:general secretion pathway protein C
MDLVHKISALRTRPPTYWLNAANQKLPVWTSGLLVIAIAWYSARLVWALVPQNSDFDWTVQPEPAANAMQAAAGSGEVNFGKIAAANLFGVAGAEPTEPVNTTEDAPETRLNLKLRGTVAADDPDFAHAIISDGGKNGEKVYFLKDKLPGGATLHEVHPDKIILNRSGTLETLRLPKLSETLGKQSNPQRTAAASRAPARAAMPAQAAAQSEQTARTVLDIIRPQPYMPNGEMRGYRIYPGRDRRKFASLGLRPGDLVTAINGQQVSQGTEIFKSLSTATELSLAIERSGSPMVVNITTADLVSKDNTQ